MEFKKKVLGVLFGTAYGDALGAVVEKLSAEEIREQYGKVTDLRTKWYKSDYSPEARLNRMRGYGVITDDTLMTMALAETYLVKQRHIDCWDMRDEFVRQIVYTKRYIPEFKRQAYIQDRLFYPEKYIFQRHILANCEPREGGIGNMVNCGAAMYIAPIGIVNAGNPQNAYNEAILFACGHQVSYGLEAAGVLAACVAEAMLDDATIDSVIQTALRFAKDGTKAAISAVIETVKSLEQDQIPVTDELAVVKLHEALKLFSPMGDDVANREDKLNKVTTYYSPSRVYSIEELPIALGFLKLGKGDFNKSIIAGINSGRDTDSIGVMIAVICGALYGDSIISNQDKLLLEEVNKQNFEDVAESFSEVASKIISDDVKTALQQQQLLGLEIGR
ncbi:ADP-ribosylglycohydrolase family protein [Lapidilactobacillus achengensis]|uniref:ADP-ribosylglycohydrolase family protein n=1 Tax=Lapidilactobacillus achengensis TaxID=2486000 RepID=A0ABW1UP49_9LACO|nr:ADP-ribosylglycohydrolase family protein [Lapidilactobacillus achengensis]